MAELTIEAEIPTEDVERFLEAGSRAISRAIEFMAIEVWGNVGREAPTESGLLGGSFQLTKKGELEWSIATAVQYASFVYEGTGIHGPHSQRILPTNAQALAFKWMGELFIRRSVAGQKPNPFVDRAIERAGHRAQEFAMMAVAEMGGDE